MDVRYVTSVIKALRCTSSNNVVTFCEDCPFAKCDDVTGTRYAELADVTKGGRRYVLSCDSDEICRVAADLLSEVKKGL